MGDRVLRSGALLAKVARSARSAAYRSVTPLDYVFRVLNQLTHYPPLHLRRQVGGVGAGFNGPGYEFVAYLRLLARLRDGDFLWDIGCGCGMLELALHDLGWKGRLIGTDIQKSCIDWAQKNLSPRFADHNFIHMDIHNAAYWPKGTLSAREWLSRFDKRGFDVVVAKSLFTHVLPDELDVYLMGIADRLRVGGKALLTFFILSEEQARLAATGKNRISFRPYGEDGCCAVRNPVVPAAAVAYEQHYLTERLGRAGFKMDGLSLRHGAWSGRADGLSFQDIIVAEK
ncbi:MAG: class I SAM-dependent methyltransferase [Planctomycetes bacterium]|nr:class I SAM-dependent methyltransferase [Planctomycetota bacterium]MBI3846151.1 class I SAM-dependent methyltransferase [Planctomycetota bacterium]